MCVTRTLCQLGELWMIHLPYQIRNNLKVDVPAQKRLLLVLGIAQDELFLPLRMLFFLSDIA